MGLLAWLLGRPSSSEVDSTHTSHARVASVRQGDAGVSTAAREERPFDKWLADMEAKIAEFDEEPVSVSVVMCDEGALRVLDLRKVASSRYRIVGTSYYVTDTERAVYGGTSYLLVREPENEHDASAVAVYGRGRKVGHLSAKKASGLAPILDGLGFDAFRIGGAGPHGTSTRLWADIPSLPALRAYAKSAVTTKRPRSSS